MKILLIYMLLTLADSKTTVDCNGDIEIQTQGDASVVSSCRSYNGNISVSRAKIAELDLSGVVEISGNLVISNSFDLKNIILGNLTSVSGSMKIINNTQLISMAIPRLSSVRDLDINYNPNMIALDLDPLNSANFIRVSQTALAGLTNLNFKRLKSIDISNNIYLQSIEFPRLTWVSGYVSIMNNHIESSLSSPKLTKIDGKLSLSGVSKLDVPALNIINGAINIMENGFKEFSFEGLETASSDLYIIRNAKLAKFAFPKLNKIGGALLIQNNTLLKDIDNNFFPQLTEMSGKMLFTGPFDSIKLPNFKKTSGAISIESSGRLSCTETKRRIDFTSKNRWVCYSNGYKFYEQEKKSELQESLAMKYSTSLFGLVDVGIALFLLMVAGVFL